MFYHLLELARLKDIKRFVYASSSSIYGDDKYLPKTEERLGNVLSPYAVTKRINELYAKTYHTCYGMETIGLRYFNVFGPKQNPYGDYAAVIPKFITILLSGQSPIINGDGSYGRDFTYIENAVQANILALTTNNSECFGEEFNIGAGGMTTIKQLYNSIKTITKSAGKVIHGPTRTGDIPMSIASVDKARRFLKYSPDIDISKGLKHTIEYFKSLNNK
jgi:UDP-N-acetylglucosamine 4-epimerase